MEVLDKVMEWDKGNLTAVEINNLLLTKDRMGHTAWHEAAELCNTAAFEILYELAREGKINLKMRFLLPKIRMEETYWRFLRKKRT